MKGAQQIYDFIHFLEEFKKMERFIGQVFWRDYPYPQRYESNADHTWRMALILVLVEEHLAQPIDFKKMMKMILIHDLPEILAGDTSPMGKVGDGKDTHAYNKEKAEQKFANEKRAAETIFGKLPEPQGKELMELWLEYEQQASYEAKVAKAIDKFEGKMQVLESTNGVLFPKHFDFTMKYGVGSFNADPAIREMGDMLLKDLEASFEEYKPQ